jgi:transcriptional regulator with XRE-family HTH domain
LILRALRRRRAWRQADLADAAGCSQALVSNVERGHVARSTVTAVRALFEALDARLQLAPSWRGAELERLLDADHAAIVSQVVRRLELLGWSTLVEVTYSEYGERGSIDVLGLHARNRAALIIEVKSDIPSEEAVARKLDEKARLGPSIVRRRAGWIPSTLGVVLVLPESPRLRRRLAASAVLARMFPILSRPLTSWLRNPHGSLAGSWFLSGITLRNPRRVRRRRPGSATRPVDWSLSFPNGDSERTDRVPTVLR